MDKVIQAIKPNKYSTWESCWTGCVLDARRTELQQMWKPDVSHFFLPMAREITPVVVSAIDFGFFMLLAKREFTTDTAFPCIVTFGMLSQGLTAVSDSLYF